MLKEYASSQHKGVFWYFYTRQIFPKFEVYDQQKYTWAVSYSILGPAHFIIGPVYHTLCTAHYTLGTANDIFDTAKCTV